MTHWQHTDPRQCPQGHSMLWLGGTYWICEPCAKLYAEGKVQPSCNKCGSTEVVFRTRATDPTPSPQPDAALDYAVVDRHGEPCYPAQPTVARIETQPGAPGFDGADVWNAQFDAADRARKAREDAEFKESLRRQAEYMKSPEFKAIVDKATSDPTNGAT